MTEGSTGAVIFKGVGATTIVMGAESAWVELLLSRTDAVKFAVVAEIGVPEITPVDCARIRPVGRLPDAIVHV